MKVSEIFSRFVDIQQNLASNPHTLMVAFCLAATAFPFSGAAAIGAAVSPTLLAGSSLLARGASHLANAMNS